METKHGRFHNLYKTYHGHGIEDAGITTSREFHSFALSFKNQLMKALDDMGAKLEVFRKGHYDFSAFVTRNGHTVYISFSVPRGERSIDFNDASPFFGFLVRTAAGTADYRGGMNSFCNLDGLTERIDSKLSEEHKAF